MDSNTVRLPIGGIEMTEFLLATTAANQVVCRHGDSLSVAGNQSHRDYIRESLRFHRFHVINWLMSNGVAIPSALLMDQTHPVVGQQMPDKIECYVPIAVPEE